MEAQMHSECLQDVDFPFPFTGRRYAKGEKFVYPIVWVFLPFLFFAFLSFREGLVLLDDGVWECEKGGV